MKNIKEYALQTTVNSLKKVAVLNVNSACFAFTYQHKLPENAKKYRKF